MARDVELEELIRVALGDSNGMKGKAMFGGWAFMLNGNLLCAVSREGVTFRVGRDSERSILALSGVKQVVMGKRLMSGWVRAAPEVSRNKSQQAVLLDAALSFSRSLPPK